MSNTTKVVITITMTIKDNRVLVSAKSNDIQLSKDDVKAIGDVLIERLTVKE
jgi:diketogulonate reductase-like aldo/keto reductase